MKINVFQAIIVMNLAGTTQNNGIWRPDLSEQMDTPETTLFDHLDILKEKDLVDTYKESRSRKGRPRIYWYLTDLGYKALMKIQEGIKQQNEQRREDEA